MPLSPKAAANKDRVGLHPMQHRHFATIATIIREMRADVFLHSEEDPHGAVIDYFAQRLIETNPKFDGKRFEEACRS